MKPTLAETQLLAVLVMDLGYTGPPPAGKSPMRHQFAWDYATQNMSPKFLEFSIHRIKSLEAGESKFL